MVRFRNLSNKFLRKHRKWPHSPFKTKWHQTFSQQQAMELLIKQSSSQSPSTLLSSLLHSFSIYNIDPIPKAYHFVIKTLTNASQFHALNPILAHIEKLETFDTPEYIFVDLIKAYGDANRVQQAVDVFYRIPNFRCVPTVYSLNWLLSVLCRDKSHEGFKMVPRVLVKSHEMKIRLEESTFRVLIGSLCRIGEVGFAIEMLHCMVKYGHSVIDNRICSLVLKSLSEDRNLAAFDVMGFLEGLRKLGFWPDLRDYANMIKLLVRLGKVKDASNVLTKMKSDGIKPDIVCYTLALNGAVESSDFVKADELFDELLVLGLVPNVYTYNVYIRCLCKQNNGEAGIKMLKSMEELGCKPNISTYNMLLEDLYNGGELSRAKELVKEMESKSIGMNLKTYKVMINGMVGKGEIIEASVLLKKILGESSDLQRLNVDKLISTLCHAGKVGETFELLEKFAAKGISPGADVWKSLLLMSGFSQSLPETSLIDKVNCASRSPVELLKESMEDLECKSNVNA